MKEQDPPLLLPLKARDFVYSFPDKLHWYSKWLVRFIALFCFVVGGLCLILRLFGIDQFNIFPTFTFLPSINASTGFIFCGLSLYFLQAPSSSANAILGKFLALTIIVVGGLFFSQQFTSYFLSSSPSTLDIKIISSFSITLVGISLFFLRTTNRRLFIFNQILYFCIGSISLITIYADVFNILSKNSFQEEFAPPFVNCILFGLLSLGLFLSRPREGIVGILTNSTLGGYTARRILIIPLFAPFIIAVLRFIGELLLDIPTFLLVALAVVLNMFLITLVLFYCCYLIWIVSIQQTKSLEIQTNLSNKLQEINRDLDDFAYVVSHDLKTPLRGLMSLAQWISEDNKNILDEESKEHLGLIMERTQKMHSLINGILKYSRAGRKTEDPEEIDLNNIIKDVVNLLAVPENMQVIIPSPLPIIHYPPVQMCEIFQNLIGNAVRFMDKKEGLIHIRCADLGTAWQFSVQDNGPGIDEKIIPTLFQIFQEPIPSATPESTGLGLSIVKKIVESWGGKIWVVTKLGEGSSFYFTVLKRL